MIDAGLVRIAACDPKGGMELLTPGGNPNRGERSMFEWAAVSNSDIADLVTRQEKQMKARAETMTSRSHTPTVDMPYVLVMVDELLNPTVIEPDKAVRAKFESGMLGLLSAGRAAGWSMVAATQRPDMDTLRFRDLFTLRVCLRVAEPTKVNMVLGPKAREKGARADKIPTQGMAGTGYVIVDDPDATDNGSITRVRAAYPDDAEIARMRGWLVGRQEAAEQRVRDAEPVRADRLVPDGRYVLDVGAGPEPVTVLVAVSQDSRTTVDYQTESGDLGSLEVDDGELFDRV